MKKTFSLLLVPLFALAFSTGCDQTNKYNPSKGLEVVKNLQTAESSGDALGLAKLAIEQSQILKDRAGAMETMRKASRFCTDIQDVQERIEVYSQIAASYSVLNALPEAKKALTNATSAYESWEEEKEKVRANQKKVPTQGDLEAFAEEKMEMLLNLAKAQMEIAPLEAQNSLMKAKAEVRVFTDILMKVDKLLDIASTLGPMNSLENLKEISEDIKSYLNGEIPESVKAAEEAEKAAAEAAANAEGSEDAENADAEEAPADEEAAEPEEPQEIDGQQKGSRLSTLAGIFIKMNTKEASVIGLELLDEATEAARSISNKGQKAITLCEIALNYAAAEQKDKAKELVEEAAPLARQADSATRESADEALTNAQSVVGE